MDKENIWQVGFDQTENTDIGEQMYKDDGIAIYTEVRELPGEDSPMRMDMFVIAICRNGKLQVELNSKTYTIHPNEVLACKPNDVVTNCMVSPGFDGVVMFLSQRYMLEQISETDIWDNIFRFLESPIVHVREESLHEFMLYGEILYAKIRREEMPFHREIIKSVVKAALYELLSNAVAGFDDTADSKLQAGKAGDLLFKKFVELLSNNKIKPRSVAWYADRLCVTPKYLSTVCKQVTGKTALHWINEYVMIDIRHYLKNSDKTIKEVADLLDFPNLSFFGKYCRQHFGVSPTEYRRQLRKENQR